MVREARHTEAGEKYVHR